MNERSVVEQLENSNDILELDLIELECVAGGPEVDNDPGH